MECTSNKPVPVDPGTSVHVARFQQGEEHLTLTSPEPMEYEVGVDYGVLIVRQ